MTDSVYKLREKGGMENGVQGPMWTARQTGVSPTNSENPEGEASLHGSEHSKDGRKE